MKYKLLSIDAWKDDCSWTWNAWYSLGFEAIIEDKDTTPRKVFALLRDEGYLSDESKGRVSLDDDGYNLVIRNKDTYEPIFALEYGSFEGQY